MNKEATEVPTVLRWSGGGERVFVMGNFTNWKKMVALEPVAGESGEFQVQLMLPRGTHRFKFVVDGEVAVSDFLPTATDGGGNLMNYLEVGPSPDDAVEDVDMDVEVPAGESALEAYSNGIPPLFEDPRAMEGYYAQLQGQTGSKQWLVPPQLPPHLENVILNSYSSNAQGALKSPHHVVLNHLATTSIKHNTLAVAAVVRYRAKYITQVIYAPL